MKNFSEEQVQIKSEYTLKGTLTIPDKGDKFPAVLIIPGTGNSDRDGKNKIIDLKIYKEIADTLSELGFLTLRYDKRGVNESEGSYYETGFWDLVDDAVACAKFLYAHPKVDRDKVIILGHSEGCLIAPPVYERVNVSGIVFLSGMAEPSKAAFERQRKMAIEQIRKLTGFKGWLLNKLLKVEKKIAKINQQVEEQVKNTDKASIRVKGKPFNAKWYREQLAYDVTRYLPNITCPVIAITGTKDIQVVPEHAQKIAQLVNGPSEWHLIPDMTHILRKAVGEVDMLNIMKEYKKETTQPMDPELVEKISRWLVHNFKGEGI